MRKENGSLNIKKIKPEMYEYASVIKVIRWRYNYRTSRLGFHFNFTNSFRLARIDCPEVRGNLEKRIKE
jgi:hypothetical protein